MSALLLTSCEKTPSDVSGSVKLIKMVNYTIIEKAGGEIYSNGYDMHFTYDGDKRLTAIEFLESIGNHGELMSFRYSGSEVWYDYAGGSTFKFENGRVVSFDNEYESQKYFYDAKGMLNQKQYITGNSTYTTVFERYGGDIVKIHNNAGTEEIIYSDYEDKMNLDLWQFYSSGPLIAEYAIDRSVFKNIGSTKLPLFIRTAYGDIIELSYEFDSDGYPVTIKSTWKNDHSSDDFITILTVEYN